MLGAALAVTAACGNASGGGQAGGGDGALRVDAGFAALGWVTGEVGGSHVDVRLVTPPGAEPHDLELTPRDVADRHDADLVVLLKGFQPALDDAVADRPEHVLDVTTAAQLEGRDPHFWLDPLRLAEVGDAVADRLAAADPPHAPDFAAGAADVRDQLESLDREFRRGLQDCERRDLVSGHDAFGYLARRYGLRARGIAGLDPTAEPTPRQLATLSQFVEDHGVTTVFFETLADPAVAKTVAAETGARAAVLDPVESLGAAPPDDDLVVVLRRNLAALRDGLGCA